MAEEKGDINRTCDDKRNLSVHTESDIGEENPAEITETNEEDLKRSSTDFSDRGVDSSNLHYEGNTCIYTDPATKCQYIWSTEKNEWELKSDDVNYTDNSASSESESQNKSSRDIPLSLDESKTISANEYEFDGESYYHTDPKTGTTYKFDSEKNAWVVKEEKESDNKKEVDNSKDEDKDDDIIKQDMTSGSYGFEGDTHTYTDAKDGTVYIWDREKNAWFPKVDEDFLAHYQMNYGFVDTSVAPPTETNTEVQNKKENNDDASTLKRKMPQEPSWFELDDQHNTKVYVSNLPLDITEQQFVDLMQKFGLIMKDADTGKLKIKLYTEPGTSHLKGDGLCTYIKIESVELALKLLDGYVFNGQKIHVERAKFQMKGSYDPNLKPKKRKKKDKEKIKKMQEKLFDWRPDKLRGERAKHESVVIVKNLFDPSTFDKEVSLILEYQQDLREECVKCGDVKRVIIYDRHPEGVAQVTFKEPEAADACIALLNGRWFGKRQITAETWDGKTKYKIVETEAETQRRLQKWGKFLESSEVKSDREQTNTEQASPRTNDSSIPQNTKVKNSVEEGNTNSINVSEKTNNKELDKKKGEITKKCFEDTNSNFIEEEDSRSSAGSSDDTEGRVSDEDEASKAVENG